MNVYNGGKNPFPFESKIIKAIFGLVVSDGMK